jgi:hypothetical protein
MKRMGILRWLERKFFTGEVIRDYGTVGELTGVKGAYSWFGTPGHVSLLLCKKRGQFVLVLRTSSHFELNWYPVKVTAAMATMLAEVAEDVFRIVEMEMTDAAPEKEPPDLTTGIRERPSPR